MTTLTPVKAIRKKCVDCSGGSSKEVSHCQILDCPLYLYRMGKRPTDLEKKELKQALKDRE